MATQTVEFRSPPSQTVTAKLFAVGSDTQVASVSTTEATNRKGTYSAAYTDVAAGEYELIAFVGAVSVARWFVTLTLTTATFQARDKVGAVELDSSSLRSALGMSAADLDSQLDAILAASGGAGTGARTITITVNDGTTALQNAVVRLSEGLNTYRTLTNASGVAVFNVDDATYTVAVTKSGYTYAGTTLIVNGTETATYSMTAVSVTPPTNPDLSAVVVLCLGTNFEAEAGVTIDLRIVTFPSGSTNTAYPGLKQTATSNGSGVATLEAPKGSVCEWKRGKEDSWTEITRKTQKLKPKDRSDILATLIQSGCVSQGERESSGGRTAITFAAIE